MCEWSSFGESGVDLALLDCWAGDDGSRWGTCSERPLLKPARMGVEGSAKESRSLSRMAISSFDRRDVLTMCGEGERFGVPPPSDKDRVLGTGDRITGGPRPLVSSATATSNSASMSDILDKSFMLASLTPGVQRGAS